MSSKKGSFDWEQHINNYSDLKHLNTYEKAYAHFTRFGIHENRTDALHFHSIFYKDNMIYVIQPIYKTFDAYFKMFDKSGNQIKLTNQIIKDQWEPIIISMFKSKYIPDIFLKFGPRKIHVTLNTAPKQENKFLTLTTLFKDDYTIFPIQN